MRNAHVIWHQSDISFSRISRGTPICLERDFSATGTMGCLGLQDHVTYWKNLTTIITINGTGLSKRSYFHTESLSPLDLETCSPTIVPSLSAVWSPYKSLQGSYWTMHNLTWVCWHPRTPDNSIYGEWKVADTLWGLMNERYQMECGKWPWPWRRTMILFQIMWKSCGQSVATRTNKMWTSL